MLEITYTTEIVRPFCEGMDRCHSLPDLRQFILEWKDLAPDALVQVQSPLFDWEEFQKGVHKERNGVFAGEAWGLKYGAILLPAVPFFVASVAVRFKVPDGLAFIRLVEENVIRQEPDGSYTLHLPTPVS